MFLGFFFDVPRAVPARSRGEGGLDEISFELCDQYTLQGDLFSMAVLNNTKVPTPISDSLANMNVLEKILNSSQSNSWSVI